MGGASTMARSIAASSFTAGAPGGARRSSAAPVIGEVAVASGSTSGSSPPTLARPMTRHAAAVSPSAHGLTPRRARCLPGEAGSVSVAMAVASVTALNFHAPAPNDPRYSWHGCAQQRLEAVRFPTSETAGRVQVRLTLR